MVVAKPKLLQFNGLLSAELGLDSTGLSSLDLAEVFSGQRQLDQSRRLAQAYAGHQFGNFVPQLGDGRALLLGEVIDTHGRRRDIALKGSGPTPFSRGGDGKAAVGPVLREYLIGEAMHALGIPTTRALAAVATGESVYRERPLPGAVLTRVAASHIRVGTFEFFAARRRWDQVRQLADYVIERHDPQLRGETDRYCLLLKAVAERQAALVAQWMLVGFIHGVMNTDNMAISGETIDYGPCAFMESYSLGTVFSSIDSFGRYAYGNQPRIAQWNLARFAETLIPLIDEDEPERALAKVEDVIKAFMPRYGELWLSGAQSKLGVATPSDDADGDRQLVEDWLGLLEEHRVDYTLAWRRLADALEGVSNSLEAMFPSANVIRPWLERWRGRICQQSTSQTAAAMRAVNPLYLPRNHLVEEALAAATEHADLTKFTRLLEAVSHPYDDVPEHADYAQPAPRDFTDCYKTFCGT